jgi:uncharacterized protein (TIGR03083 family)
MKQPQPILVVDLFPELLDSLLALLSSLSAEQWEVPTACGSWTVKDVALHLLGGDVGILSRGRDEFSIPGEPVAGWDGLVTLVNTLNETWVTATRRVSPRLLCDLLRFTGTQAHTYFASLDPYAISNPVSWAGPEPAPRWFDVAREYTERWHHQQHIRDAVGKPGLTEPRYLRPVLETFVRALPHTYRTIDAPNGTRVVLSIAGEAGGRWLLLRRQRKWQLYQDNDQEPHAELVLLADIAWRVFTKGLGLQEAQQHVIMRGDELLARHALNMVAIIA